jgi:hypothetical protein
MFTGDFGKNALENDFGVANLVNRFMLSPLIMNMKPQFSLYKHGLRVDFDADEIFPEDPGSGTPVMVWIDGESGSYSCVLEVGEVDSIRLAQYQIDWLWSIEQDVWDWLEKHTLAGPRA